MFNVDTYKYEDQFLITQLYLSLQDMTTMGLNFLFSKNNFVTFFFRKADENESGYLNLDEVIQ